MVVISNHQLSGANRFNKNVLNKLLGSQLGKFFCERDADQVLDTLVFEEVCFFLKSIEQLQAIIFRMEHEPGMWPESDHDTFARISGSNFPDPRKYFLMAYVH